MHINGSDHISISNLNGEYFRLLSAGLFILTFELQEYENYTQFVLVQPGIFSDAPIFNISLSRDQRDELKLESVKNASREEERNCQNRSFTGKFSKNRLSGDFQSVPVFKYHNYTDMLGYLLYYYRKYSKITYLHRIGNSSNAFVPYEFVITGSNPNQHELLKPEFKYVANSIANDFIGKEMLLLLIKHILESYGKNKEITDLVDTTRIHFAPSLNPEGFERVYAQWKLEDRSLPPKKKKVCDQNETLDSIDLKFPDLITPDTPKSKNGNKS